jgi:transposase
MNVKPHNAEDRQKLQARIQKELNAKQRDRYRAVSLALDGQPTEAIMATLARSKNFVQRWVYAYRDGDIDAITAKSPPGRPRKLPAQEQQRFKERFLAGPTEKDGVCALRAKDAKRILEDEFGVCYTLPGVYDLLHSLNLSCLQPRPRHRKNDPQQMQQWVENAPLLSRRCGANIRTSELKSGLKTRQESANKEH